MQDDLDVRVGEDGGEGRGVELALERIEDVDALRAILLDGDLDEAELGAVPALAHELSVDAEPPGGPGASGDVGKDAALIRH